MLTVLFFLVALLSEIVGTVAGFGSSVFFVPLASFFFEFHQVLALTSILHVFSNAAKLVFFGRHIRLGTAVVARCTKRRRRYRGRLSKHETGA